MLVEDLESPILQLEYDSFVRYKSTVAYFFRLALNYRSSSKSLAVLHPSALVLFSLQSTPDGMLCVPLYSQKLQRSAASMAFGLFGVRRGLTAIRINTLSESSSRKK